MRIVDLSHVLNNGMPVYPGDSVPAFFTREDIKKGDAFTLTEIRMTAHTGTHIDCGSHILPGGETVDGAELGRFIGPGIVVDCSMFKEGERIPASAFSGVEGYAFVLVYCGWDKHWGSEKFFGNCPALSTEAAQHLAGLPGLMGVGVEACSVDPPGDPDLTLHHILLSKPGLCIAENLCNLDRLLGKSFLFAALPLNIAGGEASPVRAVGIIGE